MSDKSGSPVLKLCLPEWLSYEESLLTQSLVSVEQRMEWVLSLGRKNIGSDQPGQGGPFAAAVFDADDHRLVAAGVNLVLPTQCSVLHAEIVALMQAQQRLGCHRLDLVEGRRFELVSSTEPCAMCLGAIPWAGVARLVCGARDEDARAVGFDEGDKPDQWPKKLEQRGIQVVTDVRRDDAAALLRTYQAQQGVIY